MLAKVWVCNGAVQKGRDDWRREGKAGVWMQKTFKELRLAWDFGLGTVQDLISSVFSHVAWKLLEATGTELEMEQQTGSKLEKEYIKAVYCHPAYLTSMQNTSSQMPGWMKYKLESRSLGEILTTSDMQMTPPNGKKSRRTKELLDEDEKGGWKSWLKAQHSRN